MENSLSKNIGIFSGYDRATKEILKVHEMIKLLFSLGNK
jgi:hypothetical protein